MSDDTRTDSQSADATPEESRGAADATAADPSSDRIAEPIPDLVEPPVAPPSVFAPPTGERQTHEVNVVPHPRPDQLSAQHCFLTVLF